jgi:hypothetical protein
MPLSYEEIQKGRRREWKQLMDPEERRRLEQEEREKDPDYQRRKSARRRREEARKSRTEQEDLEWRRTRRKLLIRGGAVIAGILLVLLLEWAFGIVWRRATYDRARELESVILSNTSAYRNFDTPLDAWASWRNAWIRNDSRDIVATYSDGMSRRMMGAENKQSYTSNLQRRIREGHMNTYIDLARQFSAPEMLLVPSGTVREGDLAVLRSRPVIVRGVLGESQRWVLALSWDAKGKRWLVEDVRADNAWDPRWTKASMIQASRLPRPVIERN